ncbi:LLM class flavin-dependent oxidoreductase [Actinomadura roseirufa]|uniref:LLM class flavin-dependent oxidoreductase n=1 Tax=Actinomadura roseirufa TaxID=2094049 RepID=UPI0013F14B1B|nr:LLM class flavin-dependent oxidoreductase [Actinomadura roseirufa]
MTPEFHLTLPAGQPVRTPLPALVTDVRPSGRGPFGELGLIAGGADLAGLAGVLAPFAPDGPDALAAAGDLLRGTRHVTVTAAFHPAAATPVYAAKLSASLQRFHAGRLAWHLVTDLDPAVARSQGDFLEGPDRYARAHEFLTIARGVWENTSFTFEGRFYEVLNGGLGRPLAERPFPRVLLSGTSAEALDLSARHADVHVFEPGDDIERLRPGGVRAGLRLPIGDRAPEDLAGDVRGWLDRGVTVFLAEVAPSARDADPVALAYRIGEHVLPLLETGTTVKEAERVH